MPFPMMILMMLVSSLSFLYPPNAIDAIRSWMDTLTDPGFYSALSVFFEKLSGITPEQWAALLKAFLLASPN